MKQLRILIIMLAALFLLAPGSFAQSSLIWDWSFDVDDLYVGPTDTAFLPATISNSPASKDNFTLDDIESFSMTYNNFALYDFEFGTSDFIFDDLSGLDLAPGESQSFTFGRLIPITTSVPLGTTTTAEGEIGTYEFGSLTDTINVHVVPEPATLLLLSGGLFSAWAAGRRKKYI